MAEYVSLDDTQGPKVSMIKIGKYSFSTIEIRHLLLALVMITLTLMATRTPLLSQLGYVWFSVVFFLTVGLGFLLHELGHKLVAQHYKYLSEFRADLPMMVLALIIASITGIVFLVPGAVMIMGNPSLKKNGIISITGPGVNLGLAIVFFIVGLFMTPGTMGSMIASLGVWINAFLGLFNMLPFWILDGKKVLMWSKTAYFSVVIPLIIMLVLGF